MSSILLPGEAATNVLIERRQRVLKLVDTVLRLEGSKRWEAIRHVWFLTDPNAYRDHRDACEEARELRRTIIDPEFGKSRQTLGIAYGERGNKNTYRRLLAVLPSTLKIFLKRFDPVMLGITKGDEYRKNWREVYKTFPEYRVTRKL